MDWLAISVQGEVEKYGVYVGIAAFFGLAVLSLLYFAQARELKRLREWAGRAPERAQELEERVVAQADAARQAGPVRRLAEMPVVPPPPVPAATAAAAPQATVEADVLKEADEEEAAAPSTNGHHAGPVPPPDATVPAPDRPEGAEDGEEAPADGDAEKAAVPAGGDEGREASAEGDADGATSTSETDAVGAEEAEGDAGAGGGAADDADAAEGTADVATGPPPATAAGAAQGTQPEAPKDEDVEAQTGDAADEDTRLHLLEPESADDIRVRHVEREPLAEADDEPDAQGSRAEAGGTPDGEAGGPNAETSTADAGGIANGETAASDAADAAHDEDTPGDDDDASGEPTDDRDAEDDDGLAVAIPRATPEQRLTASRPGAAALSRSQPSASPRRPGGPPPRRPGAAAAPQRRRSVGTVALLAGIAVLVIGAGAFVASQLLGGDDAPQAPNRSSQPATVSPTATAAQDRGAKAPADTVVAVLNGTTFNGLAGTIADQLGTAGYQRGATITNPDQTLQTSTVFFVEGARANARRIARRLNISDVRAVDAATRALAPDADVIVLAGADQAP